jgi:hypothetical protein
MKKALFLVLFLCSAAGSLFAQKFTVSGYVKDAETGENLIGASIYDKESLTGTSSNAYGFFSLTLEKGSYDIVFSYVGYQPDVWSLRLTSDKMLDVNLSPSLSIDEVTVTAQHNVQSVKSTQMSSIDVSTEMIKKAPALLGEVDVIKALQLLPGVQSGTEGASGLYVRGGGPDQNLILLDGTPVYNASHLFGFFSVFNADAINNVRLIKGGFPARYGGRASSVLDISLKEGNMKEFHGTGSVGLIASKLTLEGPIKKDKTSFILSGRRTYADLLLQPILREAMAGGNEFAKVGYYFYDLNAKINHKFSYKDRLYLSVYTGDDRFYRNQDPYSYLYDGTIYTSEMKSGLGWGNITASARWNHQFTNKLFANTLLTYSNYNYDVNQYASSIEESGEGIVSEINSMKFLSGIEDFGAKLDFDYIPSNAHYLRFGGNYIYHTFRPGATALQIIDAEVNDVDTTMGEDPVIAHEFYTYIEDDLDLSSRLKMNIGLHYSGFIVNGKYYQSLQPRFAGRFLINETTSFKASYAMMEQYIHLLTNNTIGLPTDLWVPVTENVKPQRSNQYAIGISKSISEMYHLSIEAYYKKMNHLIEYVDGASFMTEDKNWEDKVCEGEGWSYGGEVFFEKRVGKLSGWLGYTLSWTERMFAEINDGNLFPYKYDRRHDVSVVATYPMEDGWDFSAAWIFGTGNAQTIATERYKGDYFNNYYYGYYDYYDPYFPGEESNGYFTGEIEHVDSRNSLRAADYHRLDISFAKTKEKSWGEVTWTLGVYNTYNRKNPFYYYIGRDRVMGNRALIRVSLFTFMPSVSYGFKF